MTEGKNICKVYFYFILFIANEEKDEEEDL
jgi:hypothetical protein